MKLKPLPISRAKTAWGLLSDVKKAILAEPKRANMHLYIGRQNPPDNGPACGTVGCFAGWVSILGREENTPIPKNDSAAFRAINLLGRDLIYTFGHDRYYDESYNFFNAGEGDACDTTVPGTKRHALAVVSRINRFMRKNATALRAKRLHTT